MILINLIVGLMLFCIAVIAIVTIILYKRAEKKDLLEESNMSNWTYYRVKEV